MKQANHLEVVTTTSIAVAMFSCRRFLQLALVFNFASFLLLYYIAILLEKQLPSYRITISQTLEIDRLTYDKLSSGNISHGDLAQLISFNDGLKGLSMKNLASLEEGTQEFLVKLPNCSSPPKKSKYLNYEDHLSRFVAENKLIIPSIDADRTLLAKISSNFGLLKDQTAGSCIKRALILVIINSRADRFHRRHGIRQTWGNGSDFNRVINHPYAWRTLFVVGRSKNAEINKAVYKESITYQDIIFAKLDDTPHNKTLKTVVGMLWAWKFCQPYFTIKADDDIFLNGPRIFEYVNQILKRDREPKNLWLCSLFTRRNLSIKLAHVKQKIGKNRTKFWSIFHSRVYPPSCTGFANLMTFDVLYKIVIAVKDVPVMPFAEDVYISMLADKIGIKPTQDLRFRSDLLKSSNFYNVTLDEIDSVLAVQGVTALSKQKFLYRLSLNGITVKGLHVH